ncbi:GNAT family N-acetyltransferase [Paenibacillus sp. FSL L8-0436]|uniref:GNAT family N-acetyltransferase n=1 Tax=Paenibacillus sp. FSL L8-0436 TaxID=2954686 RepID=UPI003159632F
MIRKAFPGDSQEIARLSSQLGYPVDVSQLEERLKYTSNHNDHIVYVMESNHVLLGWIHANVRFLIESPPFVEIAGLVVDSACRGNGIGKQLVQVCEQWAAESEFTKIRVRTNQTRSDAVQFYNRIGFTIKKSQLVLDKEI